MTKHGQLIWWPRDRVRMRSSRSWHDQRREGPHTWITCLRREFRPIYIEAYEERRRGEVSGAKDRLRTDTFAEISIELRSFTHIICVRFTNTFSTYRLRQPINARKGYRNRKRAPVTVELGYQKCRPSAAQVSFSNAFQAAMSLARPPNALATSQSTLFFHSSCVASRNPRSSI